MTTRDADPEAHQDEDTDPEAALYTSEPLETEDGDEVVVEQQNLAGKDNIEGGGEWPDPNTSPRPPAPGAR